MHIYLLLLINVYLNNMQFLTGQQSPEFSGKLSKFPKNQELYFRSFYVSYMEKTMAYRK